LRPPWVRERAAALALEPEAVERLLRRAERLGRVARVAENRYFLPESLDAPGRDRARARRPIAGRLFHRHGLQGCSGVGRNLSIAIREYLDKMDPPGRRRPRRAARGGVAG
jgi:selenocysteine-specific elongation factor